MSGRIAVAAALPVHAQSRPNDESFSNAVVAAGKTITRRQCADLEARKTASWVEVDGHGECLRYYAAGLKPGSNPIVAAWMHGDIMGSQPRQIGHQEELGVAGMIEQERMLSERFGVPFIFLARPGAYGSSGKFWTMRHTPREAALMNAHLDLLKDALRHRAMVARRTQCGGHADGRIPGPPHRPAMRRHLVGSAGL